MSYDWGLFLELAETLAAEPPAPHLREACLRTALSRGYYAVFCTARRVLEARGVQVPREKAHLYVRQCYGKSRDEAERVIGEHLKTLHGKRLDADYEADANISAGDVELALFLASLVLTDLRRLGA